MSSNTLKSNQGAGIWAASGASSNAFQANVMRKNTPDARDDTASGDNYWSRNDCVTSSPATGLCS